MYLSTTERERRYKQLRESMAREDIEVLLVVGNNHATGGPSWATGSFRYLTDFFIFSSYGVLLFFRDTNPIMLVPIELQDVRAKRYSWVNDVRISFDYAETMVHLLQEKGLTQAKVGIVSMESMPTKTYLSLREKLPKVEFLDAGFILLRQRFIKGKEEMRLMEKAAQLNDGAYKEVLKSIRPGIKEYEIVGILEGYHRRNGADRTFNLISSGPFPSSKEGSPFLGVPWFPIDREIEKGDCVLLEITTVYGGYWNQLVRIVSVGSENSELARFHKTAVMTIQAGLEKMRVGLITMDFVNPMTNAAEKHGFKLTTPMGHFVGLDLIEGRVDSESQVVLAPGISMVIHPCIANSQGIRVILWGQTYFMTEGGPVKLNQTEDILHTV